LFRYVNLRAKACIMEIRRNHYHLIGQRLAEPRQFIQVIAGPRQVGKTTTVRQWLAQAKLPALFAVADGVATGNTAWIEQQWATARLQITANGAAEFVLIIDEIQKIEGWSETVKRMWDADTAAGLPLKVLLLGSSRLMLQQGLTESLAGRFELIFMMHWSFAEMREAFDFSPEQYAYFGGYPGAAGLVAQERRWQDYVLNSIIEPSISKDVLMLTRVDKPALLHQTFELGCTYSGQQLSYNKMVGQLQDAGNTTTLANYLQLLGEAGLLGGLEKYSGSSVRTKGSSPKLQVYNNALMSAYNVEGMHAVRMNPAAWGRWVENAVGMYLINASREGYFELYYWRKANYEVDFILKRGKQLIALEVKSGNRLKASGLEAAKKEFTFSKTLLTGTDGMLWHDFIQLKPDMLFA